MNIAGRVTSPYRLATFAVVLLVTITGAFVAANRAGAAETVYWNNYEANTLASANVDGTGGGLLNLGSVALKQPEGGAIDVAGGRLFTASSASGPEGKGQIVFANLDGSGGGILNTGSAPVDNPAGVAIDPATGLIYWANIGKKAEDLGSIAWAKLDGSGGGQLNTTGALVEKPYRVGIDVVNGRLYWASTKGEGSETISYANLNGTGGTNLAVTGTSPIEETGFSVDPAAGRLYWINDEGPNQRISYTGLTGGAGADLPKAGVFNEPFGLAFDPAIGRFYWGNYGNKSSATNAFGIQDLSGAGAGITVASAPVSGPQDPAIYKAPIASGAPAVTRSPKARASLSCSTGAWTSYPSSFVYAEPRTYAYQWRKGKAAVSGATASTLTAKSAGSYSCTVTATNQIGTASQASAAVKVTAAKLKLTIKTKKVTVKAGKLAKISVQALNQGDLKSRNAKVCVKLPKSAKGALKPKCASLGKLAAKKKKSVKLKVKALPSASGLYKLKIIVKGASAKATTAKIQVK